jgi:lysozyme family protein
MSVFDLAFNELMKLEGDYSNDTLDTGGETKFGISAKFYPNLNISSLTKEMAMMIYRRDWWDKYKYQFITSQPLANKVFCASVNMGALNAHKCLQRACRACGENIEDDGILGQNTYKAIGQTYILTLMAAYRSELAGYYRVVANVKSAHGDPEWGNRFLKGLLNRAYL